MSVSLPPSTGDPARCPQGLDRRAVAATVPSRVMTSAQLISFARGAPSLDIVDVDGLKAAATRAFEADPAGIDVDELRKLLESGIRPRLAHIIPNYQNPAGVTLSEPRRRALLDLA